jgi:hypothetical protein
MINQQMHIYKYVRSHIIILQRHVSFTPATGDQGVPARNATEKSDRQTDMRKLIFAIRSFPNAPKNRLGNIDPTLEFLRLYFSLF